MDLSLETSIELQKRGCNIPAQAIWTDAEPAERGCYWVCGTGVCARDNDVPTYSFLDIIFNKELANAFFKNDTKKHVKRIIDYIQDSDQKGAEKYLLEHTVFQ